MKRVMKMSRALRVAVTMILCTGILFTMSATCFATTYYKADLKKSQMWVNTAAFSAKGIAFNGKTHPSNPRNVWFIAEYKDETGWHYNNKVIVKPNNICPKTLAYSFYNTCYQRLQINPYGNDTTGCIASGQAWKVK